ncbi:MAG: hypothetical protein K0U68_05355 [Gammaproteobacteria bacterium]|nr:hypothetical protein [Gammaproteobacteria bacterium]
MRKLYYLTDNMISVEQVSKDLHDHGITYWNFCVHSKDEVGLHKRRVHSASYLQQRDVIRHGERGAIIGLVIATLTVLYVMFAKPFGGETHALVYIAIFGFITMFGAWAGGLHGLATENQSIAKFHDDVVAGKHLLMIDVRKEQEENVKQLMQINHPEAIFQGSESTLITPFSSPVKRVNNPGITA